MSTRKQEAMLDIAVEVWEEIYKLPDTPQRKVIFEKLGNLTEEIIDYDGVSNRNYGATANSRNAGGNLRVGKS